VNVAATISAMRTCQEKVTFGDAVLLTDANVGDIGSGIRHVAIDRLHSSRDYSAFLLGKIADHVASDHALVVQWDGFILDPGQWDDGFLNFDYIGAPWPQFSDGHQVGNGGFSLRSKRLLRACQDSRFRFGHPEDIAIGRLHRPFLEQEHGCRFADLQTAGRFSYERTAPAYRTFGFHGIFNMIPALGAERFAKIAAGLDERTALNRDYRLLMRQLRGTENGRSHQLRLTRERLRSLLFAKTLG
jgi:hypothetical protein